MANKKEVMVYPQSFSNGEKAIARYNIGASQISYDSTVTDMTVTKEIVTPFSTKYTATLGNDDFLLFHNIYGDGMVTKTDGALQTLPFPKEVPAGGSNGQVLMWNNNTYSWSNVDAAPTISVISEYKTNNSPQTIGTQYGAGAPRLIHTFNAGTYPDTISAWIQEKDYKYGILHYTMGLELFNSDSYTKWCVIDQGHQQSGNIHIIGKGLYIPFAPGYTHVPIDHTVVFLKSDVGSILSTIAIFMGLQTFQANDPNFHADDDFLTRVVHSNLTLFNW